MRIWLEIRREKRGLFLSKGTSVNHVNLKANLSNHNLLPVNFLPITQNKVKFSLPQFLRVFWSLFPRGKNFQGQLDSCAVNWTCRFQKTVDLEEAGNTGYGFSPKHSGSAGTGGQYTWGLLQLQEAADSSRNSFESGSGLTAQRGTEPSPADVSRSVEMIRELSRGSL